ncbi:hypothetical protein H257_02854 [Aphanomyces astaci]|uniref:Magnesium transporter n=3 Tax=Aphanomyces astaci TaxID=112090 RepID=W4H114_APHAT|nr:hypothetical protein H257_02854 [Aphanomyces astaci]ETV84959.1 hypothetical protein H257_02854 [Aphanomyces astaci]|eukprot:XP_009824977.1 hypothetical protein H257_02854 [Aphanomyces astaci]
MLSATHGWLHLSARTAPRATACYRRMHVNQSRIFPSNMTKTKLPCIAPWSQLRHAMQYSSSSVGMVEVKLLPSMSSTLTDVSFNCADSTWFRTSTPRGWKISSQPIICSSSFLSIKTFLRALATSFPPFIPRPPDMDLLARIKVAMADAKTPIHHLPTLDDVPSNPLLPTATGDGPLPYPPPRKPVARKDKLEHGTPMLGGQPLTLRFDITGTATNQAMTRHEALKMVQDAAATTMPTAVGPPTSPQPSRADKGIVTIPNVHMRDIRKLDNAFAIGNKPSITVRRQGILVNADPVRAVITRDACVVFLQDGAHDLIPELEVNFKDHLDECSVHGFEFTALEAILATLCTALAKDAARVLPLAKAAVDKISQDATLAGELERLRSTKNTMDELNTRVTGMRKAFVDILENEEDLRMMHLTKLHRDPLLAHDLFSFDSEDLESLIEVYLEDIYDTQTHIALMLENVQNTRTIAMLKLDAKRNYLLMVNLTLTLWTTLITVPTFVVGTFGMNLNSYVQDVDYLFYVVVSGCVLFPVGVYRLVLKYFRERGINLSWKYK